MPGLWLCGGGCMNNLESRLELRRIALKTLLYCQDNHIKDFNVLDYLKLCEKLRLLSF
jgi:hypothetical protein